MKLAVLCIPYDQGKSGVSVYIDNVVHALKSAGHELTLIVEKSTSEHFGEFPQIVLPTYCRIPVFSMIYCLLILPFRIRKNFFDRIIITALNRRCMAFRRGATVGVVHDLSQYHVQGKYDLFRMLYIKYILPYYAKRKVDTIFAVSQNSADDIAEYWHIHRSKIVVNYNGINRCWPENTRNDASGNTIIYVSRIEAPGKNHATLIKAWELLPASVSSAHRLVFIGSDWSGAEQIHRLAEESVCREQITFAGFVSASELLDHYRRCRMLVFPSLFEGFGLPLAEAMSLGAVCACSNNSSLGEIAGDAALTFDPSDPQAIADAIERGIQDQQLRRTLSGRAIERSAMFTWKGHAEKLTLNHPPQVQIFGINVETGTMNEALEQIRQWTNQTGHSYFAAFVNAGCLNVAWNNLEYREAVRAADVVWADGVGVAWAARSKHTPVKENINGTDMLPLLCQEPYRIYLLGGAPGVAEKAKIRLTQQFPNCRIIGTHDGFFANKNDEVIAEINRSEPDILLVAFGCPKQELWIKEHLPKINCKVAIGVGGLLDFASGNIPRAPLWLRKMRLEWTFRLYNEPVRLFGRYIIGNPLFIFRVIKENMKNG